MLKFGKSTSINELSKCAIFNSKLFNYQRVSILTLLCSLLYFGYIIKKSKCWIYFGYKKSRKNKNTKKWIDVGYILDIKNQKTHPL
jgi:hypothetical protein